jgi:hypothetical protein
MKRISYLLGMGFLVVTLSSGAFAMEQEPLNNLQSATDPLLAALDGRIIRHEGRRDLNQLRANSQNKLLPPYIRAYYENWYNRYFNKATRK